MPLSSKVQTRLVAGIKRFQPILANAKARDLNESDTVIIITDMLADVFGFEKYGEITSEFAIRGTYCDLAIKLDGALRLLIEGKPVGADLKEAYIKQAVDYAANQGVEWVVLTNGGTWKVFRITFSQPINSELVFEIDFAATNSKSEEHLNSLYLLTKEGFTKSELDSYHAQRQAMSRFCLGAMLISDPVIDVVRRELRRMSPDVKLDVDEIRNTIAAEVIKREVLEGDKADEARRKVSRSQNKAAKTRPPKADAAPAAVPAPTPVVVVLPPPASAAPSIS
jgi:hypothetical protein